MTKFLARSWGKGVGAANSLVLGCVPLMGDVLARPSIVTLGALRNRLGGGKGMSPSAATEPQCCLTTRLFPTVSAVLYCDVMLHPDTQLPGVPMDLVGAAVCGSREAVSQHDRPMRQRFVLFFFFKAKLVSLMKKG